MVILVDKLKIWNEVGNVKNKIGSVIYRFKYRFLVKTWRKIQLKFGRIYYLFLIYMKKFIYRCFEKFN